MLTRSAYFSYIFIIYMLTWSAYFSYIFITNMFTQHLYSILHNLQYFSHTFSSYTSCNISHIYSPYTCSHDLHYFSHIFIIFTLTHLYFVLHSLQYLYYILIIFMLRIFMVILQYFPCIVINFSHGEFWKNNAAHYSKSLESRGSLLKRYSWKTSIKIESMWNWDKYQKFLIHTIHTKCLKSFMLLFMHYSSRNIFLRHVKFVLIINFLCK